MCHSIIDMSISYLFTFSQEKKNKKPNKKQEKLKYLCVLIREYGQSQIQKSLSTDTVITLHI